MEQVFYYLQKFTYFDDYLGDLLNLLEEKGVKDKTIINIYRDHSPYMMNEDHYTRYMQASNPDMNYKKTSIERYNQPLLIYDCGNPKKEVIKNEKFNNFFSCLCFLFIVALCLYFANKK